MSRVNAEILVAADLFRLVLDLPESYRVVGAETADDGKTIRLLVDAGKLPAIAQHEPRHLILPIYQRVDTAQAVLREIKIELSRERSRSSLAIVPNVRVRD